MTVRSPALIASLDWHFLLSHIFRRIWTVLLAALVALLGTGIYVRWLHVPVYTSSAVLAVSVTSNEAGAFANLASAAAMAEQYAYVFEDPVMLRLAADHMGLDAFPGTATTDVTPNVNLIELSVEADSPEQAQQALLSILEVHPMVSEAVFTNAAVDLVDGPQRPGEPSNQTSPICYWLIPTLASSVQLIFLVLQSIFSGTIQHEAGYRHWITYPLAAVVCHRTHCPLLYREDLRKLAAYLEYRHLENGDRIFAFTAATSGEGSTTLASETSEILSRFGYRVTLLTPGADWKQEAAKARKTDEIVFIDAPAVNRSAVGSSAAAAADLTLFVIRAGRTSGPTILDALDSVTNAGGYPLACILNGTFPTQRKRALCGTHANDARQKELLHRV